MPYTMSMRSTLRADATVSSLFSNTSSTINAATMRNAATWWMKAAVIVAVMGVLYATEGCGRPLPPHSEFVSADNR